MTALGRVRVSARSVESAANEQACSPSAMDAPSPACSNCVNKCRNVFHLVVCRKEVCDCKSV